MTPPLSPPDPIGTQLDMSGTQAVQLSRARASLRQALNRYRTYFRSARNRSPALSAEEALRRELGQISTTLQKLES
ncbi:MAG: hypothetical protein WCA35_18270, partial [Kovacikia sp.]